ncbi:VWA domain-containing protein [Candidatus Woesearchaeota archaeon]|nr:VWA domain-containing protein [Candidatus Woesearchaeota archaeon]
MITNIFERDFWFLLTIPLIILTYLLLKWNVVKSAKTNRKTVFFILRLLLIIFLIIALATPYINKLELIKSSPRVKILVDNSSSYALFDKSEINILEDMLKKKVPTEIKIIADGLDSRIGDGILENIREGDSLLLVTDGNVNTGADLIDVLLTAKMMNVTVNALDLAVNGFDASIELVGPEKTVADVDNEYYVKLNNIDDRKIKVVIDVDNKIIFNQMTNEDIKFKAKFNQGYHKISARIDSEDFYQENNIYYTVVKVVEKPKILLYSEKITELNRVLYGMNNVQIVNNINNIKLDDYYALIINDISYDSLKDDFDELIDYVSEGNGLIFVGGQNSLDNGDYKGTILEDFLPIYVAESGKKSGEAMSVVLVIDISGSTGREFGDEKKVDVEKSIAISVLNDLSLVHKIGVIAFNDKPYLVRNMSYLYEQNGLENDISRLVDGGSTYIDVGLLKAEELLDGQPGSKNIILISDGMTMDGQKAKDVARSISSKNIKIFTIGIGSDTNEGIMKDLAEIGNGEYFKPNEDQKIRVIFGDSETSGSRGAIPVVIYDDQHFITQDISLNAVIYGYNIVAPKLSSNLLITSDVGDPIVVAGRYGLGRVVVVATDDGGLYAPQLLNEDNSKLWVRLVNWGIGDPERKSNNFLECLDERTGGVNVILKTNKNVADSFIQIDKNLYKGSFFENNTGFKNITDGLCAINYNLEYQEIGINDNLRKLVEETGGRWFEITDIDDIAEYVKAKSYKNMYIKDSYAWVFLYIVLFLFLIEIAYLRLKK